MKPKETVTFGKCFEDITKIKWKGTPNQFESLSIQYSILNSKNELIFCNFPSNEAPHPDFFISLNQLMKIAINTMKLDDEFWAEGWISGLTIGEEGVVITAQLDLGEQRAIINTPFIPKDAIDEMKLHSIESQAQYYIHGKRAQLSLLDCEVKQEEVAA